MKGIAGTVIDGVCRDIPKIRELGYPVFSRGTYMMTGKDRVELEAINAPVNIAGRQVRAGDILLADDSGVVVVPAGRALEVLTTAQQIQQVEDTIMQRILAGESLRAARIATNYHAQQTKRFYGLCQRIFEPRLLEFTVVGIHRPSDTSQTSCDHNEGRRT
jgi:regulator of RNase E activity RraA